MKDINFFIVTEHSPSYQIFKKKSTCQIFFQTLELRCPFSTYKKLVKSFPRHTFSFQDITQVRCEVYVPIQLSIVTHCLTTSLKETTAINAHFCILSHFCKKCILQCWNPDNCVYWKCNTYYAASLTLCGGGAICLHFFQAAISLWKKGSRGPKVLDFS